MHDKPPFCDTDAGSVALALASMRSGIMGTAFARPLGDGLSAWCAGHVVCAVEPDNLLTHPGDTVPRACMHENRESFEG